MVDSESEAVASPDSIVTLAKTKISEVGITDAVLVDDSISVRDERWWSTIRAETTKEALESIDEYLEQKGHKDFELLPNPEDLEWIEGQVSKLESGESILDAALAAAGEPAIHSLQKHLKALGLRVSRFATAASAPHDRRLYFIDYRMSPEDSDDPGSTATTLMKKLVQSASTDSGPPIALLMSRGATPDEWEGVFYGSKFLRLTFRFLDKGDLAESKPLFFLLYDLLNDYAVAHAHFRQAHALQEVTAEIAKNCAEDLCSLHPAEFGIFEQKLTSGKTGLRIALSLNMIGLFTDLVAAGVRSNPDVEKSVEDLIEAMSPGSHSVPDEFRGFHLQRLQARHIFDRSPLCLASPLAFGDVISPLRGAKMFEAERLRERQALVATELSTLAEKLAGGEEIEADALRACGSKLDPKREGGDPGANANTVADAQEEDSVSPFLVITPECDLEPRASSEGTAKPKASHVVLLKGSLEDQCPQTGKNVVVHPVVGFPDDSSFCWIVWDLRNPVVLPSADVVDEVQWKKWGRLRNQEAEQVQQKYATDILDVGLQERLPKHKALKVQAIELDPNESDSRVVGTFELFESTGTGKRLWALGHDCVQALTEKFTDEDVLWLRQYQVHSEVKGKLSGANIRLVEHKTDDRVVGYSFGWKSNGQKPGKNWVPTFAV